MQKSETIGELAKALAVAQGEIQNAKKDSENPFFKAKYADLAAIREAYQGPLSKNGLALIQTPRTTITEDATIISVETLLCHSSGEWISEELSAIPVKTDPQGIGSCITYLRRYGAGAVTGVASEDDDGNAASHSTEARPAARTAQPKQSSKAAEMTQLKKAIVDVCQMLNKAGDDTKWSAKRVDEFAVLHFGVVADALELEPMRDMVKRLSLRLDEVKKGAKGILGGSIEDKVEQERQKKLGEIKELDEKLISAYLADHSIEAPVEQLSLDALTQMHDDLVIPF